MVAVFEHHKHSGPREYPQTDDVRPQHPFSQIISLVDAYDAITAARVYYQTHRRMRPSEFCSKNGENRLIRFSSFVKMIGIFPVGTVLKLDTGEICLVVNQTSDLMRPRVLVLTEFDGSEKQTGSTVSLLETANGLYKRSVVGTIDHRSIKLDTKNISISTNFLSPRLSTRPDKTASAIKARC